MFGVGKQRFPRATHAQRYWNAQVEQPPTTDDCEFHKVTRRLGLKVDHDMTQSHALYKWVVKHRRTYYIPEWILRHWGLETDDCEVSNTF